MHLPRASRQSQSPARALGVERLEPRALLSGTGLVGQYFHNPDFTGLAAERTEAVDFAWGAAAPAPGVDADSFSVRWAGQLEAKYTETYTLRTVSDEGVRLWIDGQLVIDNWTPHAAAVNSAQVALVAGQRYDVRLEYFDAAGTAQMRFQWTSASQPLEAIPPANLYGHPEGLRGAYADSLGGAATRVDSQVDFDWSTGPPAAGVASDGFRIAWTGYLRGGHSEAYTFRINTGDAVRVWIGDELLIDEFAEHPVGDSSGVKTLEAGKWYDLRIEYADEAGDAHVRLEWSSPGETGGGEFAVVPAAALRAAHRTAEHFANPLGQGQDPWVIQWEGTYLHVRSTANSVWIDQADRLEQIHSSHPNSASYRAWTAPGGTNYSHQIWAPELHFLNGKWYVYVAASDGDNATHRMHVLERDAASPLGTFTYKGQLAASTDRWAIDGAPLEWQGQLYFIWSGWPGFTDGQQNLYIAPMSNPWTIAGNRSLIATPQYDWEKFGLPINEGPEVLIHNGQLRIIYSASGYWSPNYSLGMLTYNGAGSLLSAANWTKAPTPVFQKTADVVGVGHASFTKSPDGAEDWIVFHAHPSPGGDPDQRVIRIQPFTYNADGSPNFGQPAQAAAKLPVPSGTPDPEFPAGPGDFDASGAVDGVDLGVFLVNYGTPAFFGGPSDGEDFLAWQRNVDATAAATAGVNASPQSAPVVAATLAAEPAIRSAQAALLVEQRARASAIDAVLERWRPPHREPFEVTLRPAALNVATTTPTSSDSKLGATIANGARETAAHPHPRRLTPLVRAGTEHPRQSGGNTGHWPKSGAECGALECQNAPFDPELAAVVAAWPTLPEAMRAGILAMIRAAQ